MIEAIFFVAGVLIGAAVVIAVQAAKRKDAREVARELVAETGTRQIQDLESLMGRVRDSFGALSLEALQRNTSEFLKLADTRLSHQARQGEQDLDGKKRLIDQTLQTMRTELVKVQDVVAAFEKDRVRALGELSARIQAHHEQTCRLQETAQDLRQALVSTQERGQWGERMAEDILRMAGFIEGVNYLKQKAEEGGGVRPDYTFPLPQGRKVHMDVKFPLSNYVRFLEAETDPERESLKAQFLRDVRDRIKEVSGKDYINPEQGTLDYMLVFIPNEQVYGFIHRHDPKLLDDALGRKVVLCSPFTIFAILAVIRQVMDTFALEKTAGEMLKLVGAFKRQWAAFIKALEKVGRKFEQTAKEFDQLRGTRRRQLEGPLEKIDALRRERGLEPEPEFIEVEADLVAGELEAAEDEGEPA